MILRIDRNHVKGKVMLEFRVPAGFKQDIAVVFCRRGVFRTTWYNRAMNSPRPETSPTPSGAEA
ncbi:hypothetical protein [Mesoterricola sediminis]|uniref:hypothetical protein n=1 Tax=Mesoterricola sediminis TaxID=2927980 RepID=UPI001FAEFC5F|nr:hypothetical protein [Mesoterricola sediminis]